MYRSVCLLAAMVAGICVPRLGPTAAAAGDLELISVEKIWDRAPHNAFTDLVRFRDRWVCAFREAPAHAGGVKDSRIRVIVSDDGEGWESAATISDEARGDIRDAKFGLLPDGRLMLLTATQFFDSSRQLHQSHAWITDDLKNWEGRFDVGDPDVWTWGIQFRGDTGYSIGYRTRDPRFVRLYTTADGKEFRTHVEDLGVDSTYPNESVIVFDPEDETAYCLLRCSGPAQFGKASPPYTDWEWQVMNASVGGPEMIRLPDGRLLGGGRLYDGGARTSLFWIDPETAELTEALQLPSGGDTSYPGFVMHDGLLYVSYYSTHEGKSSIYLAKVRIGEPDEPIEIGNRLEPFVDDFLVDGFAGEAALRLHSPIAKEVVLVHDAPWEGNTSTYHTVFHDGEKYRMYYRGHHYEQHGSGKIKNHPEFICYAESDDGIRWVKPNLGLFDFQGSKENNIVWAEGPGVHNFAPFHDTNPDALPSEKYKAVGSRGKGLYVFRSADAIHWELMHEEPVITDGAFDSLNLAFYDSYRGRYVDFHRHFRDGVRDIKTAVSDDFVRWSDPEWLSYTGSPKEHLYTNAIVAYHRAPHLFVGLPKRFIPDRNPSGHPAKGVSDAVLMTSRDGNTFHRWPEAIVRPGLQASRWVNRNNLPAWGIVETASEIPGGPNELSIYTTEDYYVGDAVSLRRHVWRLDGFVSVHAPYAGGEMLTKPFRFAADDADAGTRLRLNVSTSAAGSVRVELVDGQGEPVAGRAAADCDPIFGDGIALPVSWGGESDLSDLAGEPIRLRFLLQDADVYAMQFSASGGETLR